MRSIYRHLGLQLILLMALAMSVEGADFSWQEPQAKILPNGDLKWSPKPFTFEKGDVVRYIDFENGNDNNDGTTKETAWKHHPWDGNAGGQAAEAAGPITYVFKRGVVYRGFLNADDSGVPGNPVRLTSDPEWGEGDAIIAGSERVTSGWKQATAADVPEGMPEPEKVWYMDIGTDYEPWAMWMLDASGKIERVHIARDPNWTFSNPADPKHEWAEWTWPSKEHERAIGSRAGVDEALKGKPKDFFDGVYCWTEWGGGIWGAMSLQYRSPVTQYDPEKGALDRVVISPIFDGWVVAGDRYFLEKHPSYLDMPGEYYYEAPERWYPKNIQFPWEGEWLPTKAKHAGRLYVRLPGDQDPNTAVVEVAKRDQAIRILDQDFIEISGLGFRFVNVPYRPRYVDLPGWDSYDVMQHIRLEYFDEPSAIILGGDTSNIIIENNTFYHVPCGVKGGPWRYASVKPTEVFPPIEGKDTDVFENIEICDNDFIGVDHEGVTLKGQTMSGATIQEAPTLGRISIMRNRMHHISHRPKQSKSSPAIFLHGGVTLAEVAGNEMMDCSGMGIYVVGGKGGGDERTIPLTRSLIYNNRTDHVMISANDWGQIAAWQGGPHYVFNNVASNATGYKNHVFRDWDKEGNLPRYISNAYAYYGDGVYKSYWFNNVAYSDYNPRTSKYRTQSAFMYVLGFQNYIFNNSAYNMNASTNGSIGNRGGYLGNIFANMNRSIFGAGAKGDISVAGGGEDAVKLNLGAISTVAFTKNLLADTMGANQLPGFGVKGSWRDNTLEKKMAVLEEAKPLVGDVGAFVEEMPFRDAAEHDYRPEKDVTSATTPARMFVPWALYATVGEWQFRHNPKVDSRLILGEHFYMTDEYVTRNMYYEIPRGDLIAPNATAESYVPGPLTNWVKGGAMHFDGKKDFAVLTHADLTKSYKTSYGFYDSKQDDGSVKRAEGTPLKAMRDKLKDAENLLADKGIKDLERTKEKLESARKRVEQLESQGKDATRYKKDVAKYEKLLKEGDKKTIKKLENKTIPGLKKNIAKMEARGLPEEFIYPGEKRQTVSIDTGNMLLEAYLRVESGATDGVVAGKMAESGYELAIGKDGKPVFAIAASGKQASVSGSDAINDGKWHHVLAEIDRKGGVMRMFVDGELKGQNQTDIAPGGSLANTSDFLVGKALNGRYFSGDMDFLRVCRGTLADAATTIDELYSWQFVDGPFLKDFAGHSRDWDKGAPGAIEYE